MLCLDCFHEISSGDAPCPHCGARRPPAGAPALTPEASPAAPGGTPWERRGSIGFATALGETLQESLLRPSAFFRSGGTGSGQSALLYAVVVGALAAAAAVMWRELLGHVPGRPEWPGLFPPGARHAWYAGLALLPLLIVLSAVVRSWILHLSLRLLGAAGGGYGSTLRIVSYAYSASIFGAFPFIGPPLAFFWRIVLLVTGMREVYGLSTGRALLAWMLPLLIVVLLAGGAAVVLLAALVMIGPFLGEVMSL